MFFINKIKNIVTLEKKLASEGITEDNLRQAKRYSMPDKVIARYANVTADDVLAKRQDMKLFPTYNM